MPQEKEPAAGLFPALCCPGRKREVIVGLQISSINHRENKVSRSRGSWAINQTGAPQLRWGTLASLEREKVWCAGENSVFPAEHCPAGVLSALRGRVPSALVCARESRPSPTPSQTLFLVVALCSSGIVFGFCLFILFCFTFLLYFILSATLWFTLLHACRIPNSSHRAPTLKLQVTPSKQQVLNQWVTPGLSMTQYYQIQNMTIILQ